MPMIVNVAGAGAGKTTKMADVIMAHDIPDGKVVFCIAFTNAAADNIKEKVAEKMSGVPDNIKISTIHSFLYQELIEPYYYFLYGKHFGQLSTISLPPNNCYKSKKLSELEQEGTLHITEIPEKAKWVAYRKSVDTKGIKAVREKAMSHFNSYCSAIYVDEAQDINEDIYAILSALEHAGVEIILYGDPKQDVKGFGCFRQIIDKSSDVHYFPDCYRCPQVHLDLSNTLNSVYTRSGQNSTPNSNATNLHSSQKRCCSFCISSSNASPTFQVQKSIFHQMTKPIQVTVILPLLLAISLSWNDDIHSSISGISNDLIGVIPTIGQ